MRDWDQLEQNRWIESARSGDPSAMALLLEYLQRPVLASLGKCRDCGTEPEDILSETLIRVFKTLHRLKNEGSLLAYAIAIAKNLRASARLRASKVKSLSSKFAEVSGCSPEVPDEGLPNLVREEWLRRVVRELEEDQQWLFVMLFIHGMSDEEARKWLGVSRSAFRVRKCRLLSRLREAIREFFATNCLIVVFFCESNFCA